MSTLGWAASVALSTKVVAQSSATPELLSYTVVSVAVCAAVAALFTVTERDRQPVQGDLTTVIAPDAVFRWKNRERRRSVSRVSAPKDDNIAVAKDDWVALEALSSSIETVGSHLTEAQRTQNFGRATVLEEAIAKAEVRREDLIASIAKRLINDSEAALGPETTSQAPGVAEPPPRAPEPLAVHPEQSALEQVADPPAETDTPPLDAASVSDRGETHMNLWNRLKPEEIENAKAAIEALRAEMRGQHTESPGEASSDSLEHAIVAFLQRFPEVSELSNVEPDSKTREKDSG